MKRVGMILIGLILLSLMIGTTNNAYAVLYDDFSGTYIDKTKWKWGEWVREIDSGKLLFKHGSHNPNTASSFPYTTWNNLPFSDPNSINSIQAEVTILQNQISGNAYSRARLEGRWFNDGTPGGGFAGDIWAEVGIRWTGTEFRGYWYVGRYPTASDTVNQLGYGLFPTTLTIGTNYVHYISYNSITNEFMFMIGSDSITFGITNGLPPRVGNANNPWKSLTTRVQIDNPNSSAYISATFDNVYKNGLLYDDFSSPTIDSAKWTDNEFGREILGGKMRSKVKTGTASISSIYNRMEFPSPSLLSHIQAKVKPQVYQNTQNLNVQARLAGHYYQDGSIGGGSIGEVGASVWIGGEEANPKAGWWVWRLTDFEGKSSELIASGFFSTTISLGNTYTLSLEWNGTQFTFGCDNEKAYYKPITNINPPYHHWKEIGTRILSPANKEAIIEALFDDVTVEYIKDYDNFSGPFIDKGKWTRGEFVREIETGSQKLIIKQASSNPVLATSFPFPEHNLLTFPNPNSVNSIQADVALTQNLITNTAYTRARLGGRWFNDGSPGGGMIGDIWAEVSLRGEPGRLIARWEVFRYTNPEGTTGITLGSGEIPITLGNTYNLFISYDHMNNIFTFRIGSNEYTFGPTGLPARVGDANMPHKDIGTRTQINGGASSAYISATFDNVYKNGVLYDDFSSPTIDSTKWTNYEFVREISGGKLISKIRSSTASTSTISNRLEFINPSTINAIKAKVTPLNRQNTEGIDSVSAYIGGIYYNDGTPGGGFIGDVIASVGIGGSGASPGAGWSVFKFTNTTGSTFEVLASGGFTTHISLGTTYDLFIKWDGSKFIFKINNEVAEYTPTTSINPPNNPRRELATIIRNPGGREATIEALFDDVVINLPPRNLMDFNGDNNSDILWMHPATGTVALWLMDGINISSVGVPGAVPSGWEIRGTGDFNNDSKADILWFHPATGTVAIWLMDGMAISSVGVPGAVPSGWEIRGVGDFNGDGKADVLWFHPATGTVALWLMDGMNISSVGVSGAVPSGWEIKGTGDFNNDGKSDVLWFHPATGTVAIWMMDGTIISSVGVAGAVPTGWEIKGVGDFNGDGKADVLWFHPATGTVAIWMMDGTTISSVGVPGAVPSGWEIKGVGDFNNDSKFDVLWFHPATGTVAIWMMDGTTISSVGVPGAVPSGWEIKN